MEGSPVGRLVGVCDGKTGIADGTIEGDTVGTCDGSDDGTTAGVVVGTTC